MGEESRRSTTSGDRSLEALWTAHLRLEERLSDVIDDLRNIARDLKVCALTNQIREGMSSIRTDYHVNPNMANLWIQPQPRAPHLIINNGKDDVIGEFLHCSDLEVEEEHQQIHALRGNCHL